MARKSRHSSKSGVRGGTLYGLVAGLILGLAAAVAVAVFVTKVPMPFADKASRDPAKTLLPNLPDAPDPNIGLYGKDGPAGTLPSGSASTAPLPGTGPAVNGQAPAGGGAGKDDIGNLIASLGSGNANHQAAGKPAPAAKQEATPANTQTVYYLQAGAFHSSADAQAMKARILMLGLSAQVQAAKVNGATINRVRVGPFKGIDAMNRARAKLGDEKIESSVVRP